MKPVSAPKPMPRSEYNEASHSASADANDELAQAVHREHSWTSCAFITAGLSMCITVDILQYSMPLAFLPSVLEDRGHRPMTIATTIGVYYWTGFAGGAMLTAYQVWRLIRPAQDREEEMEEVVTVHMIRRQLRYLIIGLAIGSATLLGQALHPHCWMHTACRFVQGLAGAFIFFYCFLLSVSMFKGRQQVFAMTAASTALNIAEVLGSSFGAWIFDNWGERSVYYTLGVVSMTNQVLLFLIHAGVRGDGVARRRTPQLPGVSPSPSSERGAGEGRGVIAAISVWRPSPRGVRRLRSALSSPWLRCSVVLIMTAAMVKASVEEVLPFHADHRWGLQPLQIGTLFSIVASAYISAAMVAGKLWEHLKDFRVLFGAFWLAALGFTSWCVFFTASLYKQEAVLWGNLVAYGVCLGLTHTPAALMLAEAIDHEMGPAKDAVNGVWNTMWEAGGSLGFLLGGLIAENYSRQLNLFAGYAICCTFCAVVMLMVDGFPTVWANGASGSEKGQDALKPSNGFGTSYGTSSACGGAAAQSLTAA